MKVSCAARLRVLLLVPLVTAQVHRTVLSSCHSTYLTHQPHDLFCSDAAASAPAPAPAPVPSSNAAPPVPVPVQPAPPASSTTAAAPATGGITAADLARAMAAIQGMTQPKKISMTKLLSAENVAPFLADEGVVNSLLPHLPEGMQNAYELEATLRSPQLRQSIGSLVAALQTGNFNAVLASFGLDPSAAAPKLMIGDSIGAFLDAIQHWANQQDTNMSN